MGKKAPSFLPSLYHKIVRCLLRQLREKSIKTEIVNGWEENKSWLPKTRIEEVCVFCMLHWGCLPCRLHWILDCWNCKSGGEAAQLSTYLFAAFLGTESRECDVKSCDVIIVQYDWNNVSWFSGSTDYGLYFVTFLGNDSQ
ncbi:hypothetical protein H6P81_001506 [Aristolochia fimbriata]|uniref:Uncharacterized protein n=1 Tax=Aristolochia fimbriata TaxID=158543 RepID=A0AAV7F7D6_ARIFI|nr:hypothetical protein H6P81_001506 [Aristolochia fimbriata]